MWHGFFILANPEGIALLWDGCRAAADGLSQRKTAASGGSFRRQDRQR
jgi:hypothetical protein